MTYGKLPGTAAAAALLIATVTPAAADWRQGFGTYNIGILSGENEADRLRRFSCLDDLLTRLLGVEVELYPAADYAGVMQGLLAGQLHQAGLGPSAYAGIFMQDPNAVDVVMTSANVDGTLGYYAVVITRADSGLTSIDALAGRSMAYADPNSASGYLFPRAELRLQGYEDSHFSTTGFSGGHEQGVVAVLNGQYDAAATWSSLSGERTEGYSRGNLRRMVDNGLLNMDEIQIVWQSDLIPNGPIVLRRDLPAEARALIMDFYLNMKDREPECYAAVVGGDGGGFVEIGHEFYATTIRLREQEIAASR